MKDFDALRDIWHGQTALPKLGPEEILKNIRSTKQKFSNKLLFQVFSISIAIVTFIYLFLKADFRYGTSQIAMLIAILCLFYYLFVQLRDYRKINNSEQLAQQPGEYIEYLKNYKHQRYILNTRIYTVYMFFIALVIGLIYIEAFVYMPLWEVVLIVAGTIAWFAMCYFVFMKTYIRKEESRINFMIENLERLQKQFNDTPDTAN
ncbi:hypothetical protein GS399_15675 [Pedobacter sp. HMF7647]|uniref:Uncharacterized protein n=1 Tax=Hufsiella arboris TaxID=2695275 RepID=A0A7K1YCW1_9SPHI|nr:hypothetical protein [Hufsiella arboris]MXV52414.1 hypothetical protein [Hufsiella arboris]